VIYTWFDRIAEFFKSLALVIIILITFMGYRYYEVYTLFLRWLPIEDPDNLQIASVLISVVFIFTTLLFLVNAGKLGIQGVKFLLAIVALFINLYFWEVWQGDHIFKAVISIVLSAMDYGFAILFDVMAKERELGAIASDLKAQVSKVRAELDLHRAEKSELSARIKEYKAILKQVQCPKCKLIFSSTNARNGHQANCKGIVET